MAVPRGGKSDGAVDDARTFCTGGGGRDGAGAAVKATCWNRRDGGSDSCGGAPGGRYASSRSARDSRLRPAAVGAPVSTANAWARRTFTRRATKAAKEAWGGRISHHPGDYRALLDRKDVDRCLWPHRTPSPAGTLDAVPRQGRLLREADIAQPWPTRGDGGGVQAGQAHLPGRHQRVSSILYREGGGIYRSGGWRGALDRRAYSNRNSPGGRGCIRFRPDASPETIGLEGVSGGCAAAGPFDPARFFRWRCFADYGAGLAAICLCTCCRGFRDLLA